MKDRRTILLIGLSLLIFAGLTWITGRPLWSLRVLLTTALAAPLIVVGVLGFILLPVAVHESGHVLAGWILRYRLHELNVGPLRLRREGPHWRLTKTDLHWMAGNVSMLPIGAKHLKWRDMGLSIGGPSADFVLFWASIWAAHELWERQLATGAGHGFSLGFFAAVYVAMSCVGHLSHFASDSKEWSDATAFQAANKPYGNAVAAYHATGIQWHMGLRARDWRPDLLDLLNDERAPTAYQAAFCSMRYQVHFDSSDFDSASRDLEAILDLPFELEDQDEDDRKVAEVWKTWAKHNLAHVNLLRGEPGPDDLGGVDDQSQDLWYFLGQASLAITKGDRPRALEMISAGAKLICQKERLPRIQAELDSLDRLRAIAESLPVVRDQEITL